MRQHHIILLASAFIVLHSCTDHNQPQTDGENQYSSLTSLPMPSENITGIYTGEFKNSPIAINLAYVGNGHASGYNILKGLRRNLAGTINFTNSKLHLHLSEPGNNQYDGVFNLDIDTATWEGSGKWKPINGGDEVTFNFKKQKKIADNEDFYYSTFTDTLSNSISLRPDGSCLYTYLADTTNTGQEITIRGNYTMSTDSVLSVYWQQNSVFPDRKSTFRVVSVKPFAEEDFWAKALKGEGRLFSQIMY